MQIVRHEFVVALHLLIGDVEEQRAVFAFGALTQQFQ